jgi:hypothetical protein
MYTFLLAIWNSRATDAVMARSKASTAAKYSHRIITIVECCVCSAFGDLTLALKWNIAVSLYSHVTCEQCTAANATDCI